MEDGHIIYGVEDDGLEAASIEAVGVGWIYDAVSGGEPVVLLLID